MNDVSGVFFVLFFPMCVCVLAFKGGIQIQISVEITSISILSDPFPILKFKQERRTH